VKRVAMNGLADVLSEGGAGGYLSDNDPILVGDALPFGLKLMETVLEGAPDHEGLLVAASSGFVMYGQAWVLRPSRALEATDLDASRKERERAKALFRRAQGYAGRALELRHPGFLDQLSTHPESAAARLRLEDLPALYWYAAAMGSAVSSDLSDMGLVADFSVIPALLQRGLELDEGWNQGALHELLMAMPASAGGTPERAEHHFRRAMALNGGRSVGPLVTLAEIVCVPLQDRERFERLLAEALAFDVDEHPHHRLANILAQQHASWLISRIDELFLTEPERPEGPTLRRRDGLR
jgi:predicted anti-sigma-YlaC factor YlaD